MLYLDMINLVRPKGIMRLKRQVLINKKAVLATLVHSRQYTPHHRKLLIPCEETDYMFVEKGSLRRDFSTLERINVSLYFGMFYLEKILESNQSNHSQPLAEKHPI